MKKVVLFLFLLLTPLAVHSADRYWVGGTGNWNQTSHWSTSTGGVGGETVPGSGDNAYVDASSAAASFTITVNTAASVIDLIITGLDDFFNLTLNTTITCSGTIQLDGLNATTGRMLVKSNILGTSRTITAATVSVSKADFRDITGAGGGSWNLSGVTGGSGDCGGNSNITFTTADDWFFNESGGGTYNFSDYTQWYTVTAGGGSQMASTRVVLPQDNAFFDADSINGTVTVDQDMPRMCKSLDFTGVDTMTFHADNLDQTLYGGLTLTGNVSYVAGIGDDITFEGRGAFTLTTAGDAIAFISSMNISMFGGSLTTLDAFNCGVGSLILRNGTLTIDNAGLTSLKRFVSSSTNIRALNMGNGTWGMTDGFGGTHWSTSTTTNLTFDAEASTIDTNGINNTTAFNGGGLTFNNVTLGGGGARVTGSNTFNVLTITDAPVSIAFADGTTQTVTSFVAIGTDGNEITLAGTSTGGWTISDAGGTNAVEWCDISYSTAEGGATWTAFVDDGNTDSGNNSGWNFGAPAARRIMVIS